MARYTAQVIVNYDDGEEIHVSATGNREEIVDWVHKYLCKRRATSFVFTIARAKKAAKAGRHETPDSPGAGGDVLAYSDNY